MALHIKKSQSAVFLVTEGGGGGQARTEGVQRIMTTIILTGP